MKINWTQQTVVLTGAYGGLGKALSQALLKRGANLILMGRDASKLKALKATLNQSVHILVGDVCDMNSVEKLKALLQDCQSQQHMLINNAAISQAGFLQHQTAEDVRQMIDINLAAPILLVQQLLPWLKQAEQAQIINIGSSFGGIGYAGFSTYCASKFGLRGFSQALNRELSDTQVTAHYLAPRAMATEINSSAVDALNAKLGNKVDQPEQIAQQLIKAIEQKQTERFFGWPEKLFVKINGLLPNLVSKAVKKDQPIIQSILKNEVKS